MRISWLSYAHRVNLALKLTSCLILYIVYIYMSGSIVLNALLMSKSVLLSFWRRNISIKLALTKCQTWTNPFFNFDPSSATELHGNAAQRQTQREPEGAQLTGFKGQIGKGQNQTAGSGDQGDDHWRPGDDGNVSVGPRRYGLA